MRKLTLLVSALALSAVITVRVQAQGGSVKVNVPFPFVVAKMSLPAGEYILTNSDHKVLISKGKAESVAMVLANPVMGRKNPKRGQVIFQCYERQCFLSEVWAPSHDVGGQILHSRTEIGVARHESPTYFALMGDTAK